MLLLLLSSCSSGLSVYGSGSSRFFPLRSLVDGIHKQVSIVFGVPLSLPACRERRLRHGRARIKIPLFVDVSSALSF